MKVGHNSKKVTIALNGGIRFGSNNHEGKKRETVINLLKEEA